MGTQCLKDISFSRLFFICLHLLLKIYIKRNLFPTALTVSADYWRIQMKFLDIKLFLNINVFPLVFYHMLYKIEK